jgi:hypothetical protein
MRIGRVMIDTDNMSDEELTTIINDLRAIRTRKREEAVLRKSMNDLILEAKEKGFTFIDNTCGFVREIDDFTLYDERA